MASLPAVQRTLLFVLTLIVLLIWDSHQEGLRINKRQEGCSCGTVNRRTRIVGGNETEVNEYPWMVEIRQVVQTSLGIRTKDLCGGALIGVDRVVTAAHCFLGASNIAELFVYLGDHDLSRTTETDSVIRAVSRLTIHPNYNNRTQANDIAILKLATPVVYQRNIQPVCIPPVGLDLTGQDLTVTGWGSTEADIYVRGYDHMEEATTVYTYGESRGGPSSEVLLEVTVPVINTRDCGILYNGTVAIIDQSVVCAGMPDGSRDACQGDSGGPAVFLCDGRYMLAGVVSFGIGCGNPRYPGVFSNMSYFRSWVINNVQGSALCASGCYPQPPEQTDCGWANNSPPLGKRIVGGSNTTPNKYPWMVSVYINRVNEFGQSQWEFSCGATVIGRNWLLTNAKCVSGVALSNIFFVVGDYNINQIDETGEQEVYPASIVIHPNYNTPLFANDVAVIKLTQSLTFSAYVYPVCIPSLAMIAANFSDTWTKLAGWGRTFTRGPYASQLKDVSLYVISNSQCRQYYGTVIQDSMLCTASSAQGDACEGDNGGPLMMQGRSGRYYEVAVQSFRHSDGCGRGNPSGYSRIAQFSDWIRQTTGVKPASNSDILPAF